MRINRLRLLAVLAAISILSGIAAYYTRNKFGGSTVCRARLAFEPKKSVIIETAGLPVTISASTGDRITAEYVSELPLITEETEDSLKIAEDDGFAVSVFSRDSLKYHIKITLPIGVYYDRIRIKTAGGNIDFDTAGLGVSGITAATKNGGINIKSAAAYLNLTAESGEINVDYDSFLFPAFISSKRGNVTLNIPDYSSVSLDFVTETGRLTAGTFFEREYIGFKGTVFDKRGKSPRKLYVGTKSADLIIKEKDTDVIGNYPRI